ncbi:serine/threonine-protein kinase [uncultured Roseovarius sp.]|uniref:serine/threonine-protein kinase n=1 Tax=uncultured Roseovarius sp. TaxID=293344 RepID=UPI0026178C57|nr:serine/threonine-protein kinase [uncultured Roseovarius sp.]
MNVLSESLQPGTIIQDTYKITKLMGEGGMGATFAGVNLATDHDVAIKVISASFVENTRAIDLFKREANLLRSIQHEAVVRYETTLQDKDGRLYLVMELLEGEPLSYYVAKGARLSPDDVLKLGRRLAGGLDAIAAVGIVHRDIAPDNIFVPDGDIQGAKLIDFGLASNTIGTEKTILGDDFAGKFSYCAPEQLGVGEGKVSARTDAYALGLVLMKIAGLPVPGEGEGMRAGMARREDLLIPEDQVGPQVADVLSSLLRANPDERPSPITPVFERALSGIGQPQEASDNTKIAVEKVTQGQSKSKAPLVGGVVGVAAVIAAVVFFMMQGNKPDLNGQSKDQAEVTETILEKDDPFAEANRLRTSESFDERNGAFAALKLMGDDTSESNEVRIKAYIMIAEMADPETFEVEKSAFEAPDPRTALRYYKSAADLGSQDVSDAISRLEN